MLEKFKKYTIKYRTHALKRMMERNISFIEIDEIVENMEIIKEYPEDKPFQSYLTLGFTAIKRPIHMVFSIDEQERVIFIISVYEPDSLKWENDFKRRKK